MKIKLIIIFIGLSTISYAQNKSNKVTLEIIEKSDTIEQRKDAFLILSLFNNTNFPIIIHDVANIKYNVFYCNAKDSISFSNLQVLDSELPLFDKKYEVLESNKSKQYRFILNDWYFKKTGLYKVNFFIQLSHLNQCVKDVKTPWMYIYVKNPFYDRGK